jgi:hypothetical protein
VVKRPPTTTSSDWVLGEHVPVAAFAYSTEASGARSFPD